MLELSYFIVILYSISILLVFFYSIAQFNLLLNYLKSKKIKDQSIQFDFSKLEEIPYVTIQLPIFNEKYVIERLLTTIAQLEYPREKLEIQVLDDSTDDSVIDTALLIEEIAATGIDIKQIKRTKRSGFKAGALKEG